MPSRGPKREKAPTKFATCKAGAYALLRQSGNERMIAANNSLAFPSQFTIVLKSPSIGIVHVIDR